MKIKTTPTEIWGEYEKGQQYKESLGLYQTVKMNQNFVIGRQWEGVNAPDLEKPVLNFLRRIVGFFVSIIVSDDIGVSMEEFKPTPNGGNISGVISTEVERVLERVKARNKNRLAIRSAAINGDAAAYFYFDPDVTTGMVGDGEVRMELVSNTKVIFGEPHKQEAQEQPYILVVRCCLMETVKERAAANGVEPAALEGLRGDCTEQKSRAPDLVTTIVKLYKQNGTIWVTETAKDVVIKPPTDLGYRLYPLAWITWEAVEDSYHGQAAVTGVIPNQIYVNKLWAMFMEHQKANAFPKMLYDGSRIKEWSNRVGEAIRVNGAPGDVFATVVRGGDISAQAMELVEKTISYTKEFLGASDAALGNIRPENTSAIIAVQKASSAPLELQRMAYFQFVEDYVRIIVEMIRVNYGMREAVTEDESGNKVVTVVDFAAANYDAMEINVDVGASAYWSELAQMQTMDSLFARGIITDGVTYLEGIPSKYIPKKNKLLEKLKSAARQQGMGGENSGDMPEMPT